MTFDFTPRFYQSSCAATPQQPILAQKCVELQKAAAVLSRRQNCIVEPEHVLCQEVMKRAKSARAMDRPLYEQCIAKGEQEYNKSKPLLQQRSLKCAYEAKGTGGPNSKGTTWRRLLPGACRNGTFVGRDGLDCCSGIPFADGPLAFECNTFYLYKTPTYCSGLVKYQAA